MDKKAHLNLRVMLVIFSSKNLLHSIVRIVEDGNYGSIDPSTGRWNGMMGELKGG